MLVEKNVPGTTARIDGFDPPVTRANLGAEHRADDQRMTSGKYTFCPPPCSATAKLWVTGVAGLTVALPSCVAVIEQVPTAIRVTLLPLTVQTPGVLLVKLTGRPDEALALKAKGRSPSCLSAGLAKVIVWSLFCVLFTAKD